MTNPARPLVVFFYFFATLLCGVVQGAPNFAESISRPLHFHPENGAFVVENGKEVFNRPLYGLNTPFRVDAGDRPEFSLYLPGRGGNLRIGIKTTSGAKWLIDADNIVARYVNGMMRYEIHDRLLGAGKIDLSAAAMNATEGFLVRMELTGSAQSCELICAFGGANGVRGNRDGDIGAEREPVSQFFQLKPAYCTENTFELGAPGFVLRSKSAKIAGIFSEAVRCAVVDANKWASLDELLASAGPAQTSPIVVARSSFEVGKPWFVALQRLGQPAQQNASGRAPGDYSVSSMPGENKTTLAYLLPPYTSEMISSVFDDAQKHWMELAHQVRIETPDPYLNAAVPALCLAADGVWDSQVKAFMHGAVAWRTRLLGWRGGYTGDALGWHDRTREHLMNWFPKQNVELVSAAETGEPAKVPADETARLARNEPILHSNGDLTKSHYDMNIPGIDVLFRHLLWTGDLDFAREIWPVVERHLAWERRLFRRPFGPDKLPLYEAYCCIWASDDLQYNGGGATHATAYNYYHNTMAARLAKLIGKDPSPYEKEAELILRGMRRELWLPDRGWYAEWKDLLGLQLTHPNAALWTFYHTIDSEVTTTQEAWQMSRFVDTQMPHLPLTGKGVPEGDFFTLPTTTWMPYTWSTNNVVMAESAHTALAYWQSGRSDEAFRLYKGCLLDSMFMGLCPGNVGMCTPFDMARGETQRDFADGVGMTSRALIEGLFGVKPDALSGVLNLQPGFPSAWDHAKVTHPDFTFAYKREGQIEKYEIETRFPRPMALRLVVPALRDTVARVTINGQPAKWRPLDDAVEFPRIEILGTSAAKQEVVIAWKGEKPATSPAEITVEQGGKIRAEFAGAKINDLSDPQHYLSNPVIEGHSVAAVATGLPGHSTAFVRLQQGGMIWLAPLKTEIREKEPPSYAMTDWTARTELRGKWDCVDLSSVLNDKVTNIFKNDYLSPRSPYCSLAIPKQGIGSWIHLDPAKDKLAMAEIDDSGLRTQAQKSGGRFVLPQGVPFQTAGSGGEKNVAFVSQWDNYPREVAVQLHGNASHLYLLMAGSTNSMQSRFENGEVLVTYADGSSEHLALENPTTWWPIDQDYLVDDFAFRRPEPFPLRVDLKTGAVRLLEAKTFKGKGGKIPGGAATVLDLALKPEKKLKSLTVRARANEVVIGLISATLLRSEGLAVASVGESEVTRGMLAEPAKR